MRWRWGPRAWYGLSALVMFLVTADVLFNGRLRHLDWTVHRFDEAHIQGGLLRFVDTFTLLGQRWVLLLAIVPLAVAAGIRARTWRYPVVSIAIVVVLSILQIALKSVIPRSYPVGNEDVLFQHGNAYPSGHTLNAFLLGWVVLELLVVAFPAVRDRLPSHRRHTMALVAGVLAGTGLVLADKHWLTDVLFSLALGPVLLAWLVAADPFTRSYGSRAMAPG